MKEIKCFTAGLLAALLLLFPASALAKAFTDNITVYLDRVNININGVPHKIDSFIYNNTTYVPLRSITSAFGKELSWDGKTNTAFIRDSVNTVEKRGNSLGNTANHSYVASEGDWIYYKNPVDGDKIYRMKKDGSSKIKIYDNPASGLNVVDGWLYFNSLADGGSHITYKMKVDGSGRTLLFDDSSYYMNVVDDWIYYANGNEHEKIYKMRLDGSGNTRLNEDYSTNVLVKDGWIYYVAPELYNMDTVATDTLYKIRTDGTEKIKLGEDLMERINIEGEWIYYINYHKYSYSLGGLQAYLPNEVYKIRLDGSEKTKVIDEDVKFMNVVDDWIYYATENSLCKVRTDGSGKSILLDETYRIGHIYSIDDYIYYEHDDMDTGKYGPGLYRMKTDGTGKERIY